MVLQHQKGGAGPLGPRVVSEKVLKFDRPVGRRVLKFDIRFAAEVCGGG